MDQQTSFTEQNPRGQTRSLVASSQEGLDGIVTPYSLSEHQPTKELSDRSDLTDYLDAASMYSEYTPQYGKSADDQANDVLVGQDVHCKVSTQEDDDDLSSVSDDETPSSEEEDDDDFSAVSEDCSISPDIFHASSSGNHGKQNKKGLFHSVVSMDHSIEFLGGSFDGEDFMIEHDGMENLDMMELSRSLDRIWLPQSV